MVLSTTWRKGIFGCRVASPKLRGHLPCMRTNLFYVIIFSLWKDSIALNCLANQEKSLLKKQKSLLLPFFLFSRAFWSFPHAFDFFIIFYIWSSTKLFLILHDNKIKTILKILNCPLMLVLKILLLIVFWYFHYAFEMQKKKFTPDQFDND
jgi:hypothetical protein